jgi:hypothetical protein
LVDKNDYNLLLFEKNLSITTAIDGLKLKKLAKVLGDENAVVLISYVINRFNSNFNVGKSLSDIQSAILAYDIIEKYPYETIEDIVLMLKMVRQGSIGDGKDYKLDGQNVMTKWFPQYMDLKYQEFERLKQKEKELFAQTDENAVSKYYEKMRKAKAEKKIRDEAEKKIDKMVENINRKQLEEIIEDWNTKVEMKPYLDYLKRKRQTIKE